MKILFENEVRASLWPPCNDPSVQPPRTTRSFTIPRYSVIEIEHAGLSYDGIIVAHMPGGWRLYVSSEHGGNVNFLDDICQTNYYKLFDPIAATNQEGA